MSVAGVVRADGVLSLVREHDAAAYNAQVDAAATHQVTPRDDNRALLETAIARCGVAARGRRGNPGHR